MFGVYSKKVISYESVLPKYTLATDLSGKRITHLKINTDTKEKIYDKEGKEVDSIPEDANEEDYKKEQVKINPDENLTRENYKKAKEILQGRLKDLGVDDYAVRLNEDTGDIIVELPDNIITDTILQYLLCKGDFSMQDSENKTELMNKSDVKNASVVYGNDETGEVIVYLDIKFNKEGAKKLAEISKEYIKVEEENKDNEVNNETTEETSSNQKKVSMIMEGSTFRTTYFGEEMKNGELTIAVGSGKDNQTVYEYATQAQVFTMLLNNEEMPIEYKVESSEYIASNMSETSLYIAMGIVLGIAVLLVVYLIFRYKSNGIIASLAFISSIALLLLMVRYTNTSISIGDLAAMLSLIVFDAYFMIKILNQIKENSNGENVKFVTYATYLKRFDVIIVFLIIAVVFTFMPQVQVFSIGMTLFYGVVSLIVSNLVFMRNMLIDKYED